MQNRRYWLCQVHSLPEAQEIILCHTHTCKYRQAKFQLCMCTVRDRSSVLARTRFCGESNSAASSMPDCRRVRRQEKWPHVCACLATRNIRVWLLSGRHSSELANFTVHWRVTVTGNSGAAHSRPGNWALASSSDTLDNERGAVCWKNRASPS